MLSLESLLPGLNLVSLGIGGHSGDGRIRVMLISCSYLACCDGLLYACCWFLFFSYAAVVASIFLLLVMCCTIIDWISANAAMRVSSKACLVSFIISTNACAVSSIVSTIACVLESYFGLSFVFF